MKVTKEIVEKAKAATEAAYHAEPDAYAAAAAYDAAWREYYELYEEYKRFLK